MTVERMRRIESLLLEDKPADERLKCEALK